VVNAQTGEVVSHSSNLETLFNLEITKGEKPPFKDLLGNSFSSWKESLEKRSSGLEESLRNGRESLQFWF
jgi:hypothetical protein